MKGIMGTLESFKSEKPADILVPQSEPEDPAVWPPPTPAEHRCVSSKTSFEHVLSKTKKISESKHKIHTVFLKRLGYILKFASLFTTFLKNICPMSEPIDSCVREQLGPHVFFTYPLFIVTYI